MKYDFLEDYCTAKKAAYKEFKAEWGCDRYMIRDKMFLMHGRDNEGKEILTLKLEPLEGEHFRRVFASVKPGYYMNKEHWNSIYTDGDVPAEVLKEMIDKSYGLILRSFSKKAQAEMLEG